MRIKTVMITAKNYQNEICRSFAENVRNNVEKILNYYGVRITNENPDLGIAIGGDGTALYLQEFVEDGYFFHILPCFKKEGGSLGFYSQACREDYEEKLRRIFEGDFIIKKLLRLKVEVVERDIELPLALNEVQIYPDPPSDLLKVELHIESKEKEIQSSEALSSLLIYTPTGSFAYARNLGGEIIEPYYKKIGIVAGAPAEGLLKEICLILDENSRIEIEVKSDSSLSIDSKKRGKRKPLCLLEKGDIINVRKGRELDYIVFSENWWKKFL